MPRAQRRRLPRPLLTLGYAVQAAAVVGLFALCRVLPLPLASGLGARLGRLTWALSPARAAQVQARIARALPHLSRPQVARIARAMGRNLGRILAEYPHLGDLAARTRVIGLDHWLQAAARPGGAVVVTAHIGNWEMCPVIAHAVGTPLSIVVRSPNNPALARLLWRARAPWLAHQIEKRQDAGRAQMAVLRGGGHLGTLFDVRLADELLFTLFGREVQVPTAAARLALHFGVPYVPVFTARPAAPGTDATGLVAIVYPPPPPPATGDRRRDAAVLTQWQLNLLEAWIRAYPEQWMWLHDLWGDTKKQRRGGTPARLVFPDLDQYIDDLNRRWLASFPPGFPHPYSGDPADGGAADPAAARPGVASEGAAGGPGDR